jgi:multicomponent Na+:H+ antiporter subunit C
MELLLAIVVGVLYASGLYLMLRRRLAQLIIGLSLMSHGTNILIFTSAGLTRSYPPIVAGGSVTAPAVFADPVPQALVLAHRVQVASGSDDIDSIVPDHG